MLRFQPQRASPMLRSTTSNASSGHELSGTIAQELQNLTADDVDILEAVIRRAGPSATTFFTVFKAYSDVLRERGVDPQEVVYYGKLLKLGTLKGKNWGEKWEMVKAQFEDIQTSPIDGTSFSGSELLPPLPSESATSDEQNFPHHLRRNDRRSRKSTVPRLLETPKPSSKYINTYPPQPSMEMADSFLKTPTLGLKVDNLTSTVVRGPKSKQHLVLPVTSEDEGNVSSPVPPSYKSTLANATLPTQSLPRNPETGYSRGDLAVIRKTIIAAPKERAKPVVDLDDAWKNIKMEQDEKYADEFRESMLLARCWDIWKQGYLWIQTTHQQIQEARDKLLLRLFVHRWRARMISLRHTEDELVANFAKYHLKRVLGVWQAKVKQKRQTAWRNDMRQKMKMVKSKSELRVKRDAWTKWQQLLLLLRAHRHYELGLLFRYHARWKEKLTRIDGLDHVADEYARNTNIRNLSRFWDFWKRQTSLQHREVLVFHRVNCRVMADTFDMWGKRMTQIKAADAFSDKQLLKRAIRQWRNSEHSVKALEHRSEKYIVRQNEVLLRAVIRIWRARMRGKRLQQFRTSLTLKNGWEKWRYRLAKEGAQLDVAKNFLNRTDSRLAASAFQRWNQVLTTHRNASAYAIKYDEAHLQARLLLLWRLRLRDNLQSVKVATWANIYFGTRKAWQKWVNTLEERKRQKKVKEFNLLKARRIFDTWRDRTRKAQYFRECEDMIQDRVAQRITRCALTKWTNRVIEIKSLELDVAHQADVALRRAAWVKWRSCRRQHAEEVRLLESYLLVKREGIIRRAFHRWSAVKRAAEHRRLTHERKEAHLQQVAITSAWERWREKFKEERLRPLEIQVILDNQRHILDRAFSVWVVKADSLPAIRFHSRHLKEQIFKKWRKAMPNALRAKKARETDRYNTLAHCFEKWVQAHKTKMTLKAVARAKYLRLPISRPPAPPMSRPLYSGSSNIFPRRRPSTPDKEESHVDDNAILVSTRRPFLARPPVVERTRSEKSPSRSEFAPSIPRQPSPVRSIISVPDRRSKSPASRYAPSSITGTAVEGDRLWAAIKKVGATRRPRNL